jgi:hypothetical protein
MTIDAPSLAKRSATLLPILIEAPVRIATFPPRDVISNTFYLNRMLKFLLSHPTKWLLTASNRDYMTLVLAVLPNIAKNIPMPAKSCRVFSRNEKLPSVD